jgi:hypothetical protein
MFSDNRNDEPEYKSADKDLQTMSLFNAKSFRWQIWFFILGASYPIIGVFVVACRQKTGYISNRPSRARFQS